MPLPNRDISSSGLVSVVGNHRNLRKCMLAGDLAGGPAQQFLANHKQVDQDARGKQSIAVLLESSVAYLHESEFQFQHLEHMLDLTSHP